MKRILLQVSGSIHLMFTLGWFLPMMIAFIGGTADMSLWCAVVGLISIIAHLVWAMTEAEWIYQMSKRKR